RQRAHDVLKRSLLLHRGDRHMRVVARIRSGIGRPFLLLGMTVIAALASASVRPAAAANYRFSWSHPRPQGNSLGGAAFENDLIGYAVGDRGVVVKTGDG